MQDRTINNALLALRKQMIRGNLEGQEHVEALLRIRGLPLPRVLPAKQKNVARRMEMHRIITEVLAGGRMTRVELVAHVAEKRPQVPPDRVYWRTDAALSKLRAKGLVQREGRLWGLAQ
ncbi:MAG: hypothetical protein COB40_13095 [Marinosulfonomonas sp.]|nr:MAG: hypothetical protein COB40_13095 [Marinosulfonomonas sp.]